MKIATIIARILLGLIFVVFGSNIFLHFIPMPPPPPGLLGDFSKALFVSHYLHFVAVFQTSVFAGKSAVAETSVGPTASSGPQPNFALLRPQWAMSQWWPIQSINWPPPVL